MAATTSSRMEIEKMSVKQLRGLKEQADLEVNLFQDSLNNICTATTRLELASTALHDLSLRPRGKKILVPLTASLYVPGTLDDAEKFLLDVGTGYFIEDTEFHASTEVTLQAHGSTSTKKSVQKGLCGLISELYRKYH